MRSITSILHSMKHLINLISNFFFFYLYVILTILVLHSILLAFSLFTLQFTLREHAQWNHCVVVRCCGGVSMCVRTRADREVRCWQHIQAQKTINMQKIFTLGNMELQVLYSVLALNSSDALLWYNIEHSGNMWFCEAIITAVGALCQHWGEEMIVTPSLLWLSSLCLFNATTR